MKGDYSKYLYFKTYLLGGFYRKFISRMQKHRTGQIYNALYHLLHNDKVFLAVSYVQICTAGKICLKLCPKE